MTSLVDTLRNKMMPFMNQPFLFCILLSAASVHSKPIVGTTESPVIARSIEFSGHPKIVDISLPLSLSTSEDLINWATYAIRLMASRINVTVDHSKNDSKPSMQSNVYSKELLPKMESIMEKLSKQMPKIQSLPTKPTARSAESKPRGFELLPSTTINPAGSARSFEIYPKINDPRYPYNPFAGIYIETAPHLNPFVRYAPNIVNGHYDQSGTRIYPEPAIFPGVGYLPLSNRKNPFSNPPTKDSTKAHELRRESTTPTSTTVELSVPEKIQSFNNELKHQTDATTIKPLITVPFEAYITITRDASEPITQVVDATTPTVPQNLRTSQKVPDSYSTINQRENYYSATTRDPPDDFPPFFNGNGAREKQNTKVEVIFEDDDEDEVTTSKSEKKKEKLKKDKEKSKKKKKQQNSPLNEVLMKLIVPTKKTQSTNNKSKEDQIPPLLRIINERNQKLKKQQNKKKKTRLQNVTLETDVDDYDDEKPGENDGGSDEEDDVRINETGANSSQEEEEEMMGSIQAIIELLPFIAPVLEDLSDPNTMTDFLGILQGALPLIQGLLEGDEDTPPLDIAGTIGPVLASISAGPNGEGSDVAAILGPVLTLVAPLIGQIVAPLIGPLLRLSSNPPDKGFSLGALVNSVAGPLSQPTEPGGMSPFSNLVTQIVAGLSREVAAGNTGSDIGALVGSVLMGVIAGTSAGLSGGSSGGGHSAPQPAYGPAHGYGPIGSSTNYGNAAVPANSVNPLQIIGMSLKDILNAGVTVVSSLITAATSLLGASSGTSSAGSSSEPQPAYGPPPPNYNRPRKFTAV